MTISWIENIISVYHEAVELLTLTMVIYPNRRVLVTRRLPEQLGTRFGGREGRNDSGLTSLDKS
jgi:hypothetical protein